MPLVAAKCTNCGANLKVDASKDAAICEHCGCAFVVEKAINYYNIGHVTVNIAEKSDIESLRILAQEALLEEDYKQASKLYYRIFSLDHTDVLSKLFYKMSLQFISLSEEEKVTLKEVTLEEASLEDILEDVDSSSTSYWETQARLGEKKGKAMDIGLELLDYSLEHGLFDKDNVQRQLVAALIKTAFDDINFDQTHCLHDILAVHQDNSFIKELSLSLAKTHLASLDVRCSLNLEWINGDRQTQWGWTYESNLKLAIDQAQRLKVLYPELTLPPSISKASETLEKRRHQKVRSERIKKECEESEDAGYNILGIYFTVLIGLAILVLFMIFVY